MIAKIRKFPQFIKEVKSEVKKVSWPSKEELVNATIIVLIAAVVLTTYIASLDMALSKIIQYFLK